MLVVSALSVRYPGSVTPALVDVDLALAPGEFVAVTGPNGSGKTTLQRAMLGLTLPNSGRVTLDGRSIAEWPRRAIAETIGALPQREESAFPLSVREAVLLGRWASLGPISPIGAEDDRAVANALARCDLVGFEERRIDALSGGEWQRVRVARALASSPRFLLLDEPTASLDVGHEMELFELLRSLVSEGLGVLVITHHLNLAARFADRVMLLDHGRVAACGAPSEVLTPELVSAVFQWPVAVMTGYDGAPVLAPLRKGRSASFSLADSSSIEGRFP